MKKIILPILLTSLLAVSNCSDKVTYVKKTVIKVPSGETVIIDVPESCGDFENGIETNIKAMVKYAGQEVELQAEYNKILLISEFSDRLKAITIAQCKIIQNSTKISTTTSDEMLYHQLVRDMFEYQKARDLMLTSPSQENKDLLNKTILHIYESIYTTKSDELKDKAEDYSMEFEVAPGAIISAEVDGKVIGTTVCDANSKASITIPGMYRVTRPGEFSRVKIKVSYIGFADKVEEFNLSMLMLKNKNKTIVKMNLDNNDIKLN